MGMINRWAEIASHFPESANLLTQTPGLSKYRESARRIDTAAQDSCICEADIQILVRGAQRSHEPKE